jgi:ribosome-associated protein
LDHEQLKAFVIEKVEDLKGRDIIDLDVAEKSSVTETMLICTGNSKRHVISIDENVVVEAKRAGTAPLSIEGRETGDWVLVDLGDVVLHVMEDDARNFYQLEKLWG